MRSVTTGASVAMGLLLIGSSLYFLTKKSPVKPPSYSEIRGSSVEVAPNWRSLGEGGCGKFEIQTLELTPTLIIPTEAKVGETFLIGLSYEITDVQIAVMGEINEGFSTEECAQVGTIPWDRSDANVRSFTRHLHLRATLALAGVDPSPKEPLTLKPDSSPVYWSVRASASGTLKGWVALSEDADSDILIKTKSDQAIFSIKIAPSSPTPTYFLSVVGSVLGTLLVSLPAWLAWYDKRRPESSRKEIGKIIIP